MVKGPKVQGQPWDLISKYKVKPELLALPTLAWKWKQGHCQFMTPCETVFRQTRVWLQGNRREHGLRLMRTCCTSSSNRTTKPVPLNLRGAFPAHMLGRELHDHETLSQKYGGTRGMA